MRIPRIYQAVPLAINAEIVLSPEASNHLLRVLRLKEAAKLIIFNGEGGEYSASISRTTKKDCWAKLTEYYAKDIESPVKIHLAQGIARGEKMDFIIQKSVELGVAEITPLFSEFCDVHLDQERQNKRLLHWQNIAINACEQSGRTRIPKINAPQKLSQFLVEHQAELKLFLHPYAKEYSITHSPQSLTVLIGPEGGFSEQEVAAAVQQNYQVLSLGPRILRTETASIACLTIMQYCWGDFQM